MRYSLGTRLRDERGLGLVELAVAIVVLGIILVGFFPFVVSSIQLSVKGHSVAAANRLVAAQLGAERNDYETNLCVPKSWETVPGAGTSDLTVKRAIGCAEMRRYTINTGTPTEDTVVITLATVTIRVDSAKYGEQISRATTQVLRSRVPGPS